MRHRLLLPLALVVAAACSPGGDAGEATDTAPAATATPDSAGGMAGMDHANMPGMNRPAPRDSNQALLRMMSDHHEGLIAIADSAEERVTAAAAKTDAQELKTKQEREQQEMLAMLTAQYQDSIAPMILPSNQAMLDSTLAASGAASDPTFYRQVIHHHREGIRMSEALLPHLTGEVRQMTERMIADQRREIEEFERKAQATPGG